MKVYETYPVLRKRPDGYHFESPAVVGNKICWSQIHRTSEPKSPGAFHWLEIPEGGFSSEGLDLEVTTIPFDEPVPGIIPTDHPSKAVVAKERTLHLLDLDDPASVSSISAIPQICKLVDSNPEVRINDCQAGFDGLPYVGTMAYDCVTPLGKWGRISPDGTFEALIEGVTISNGFDWTEVYERAGRAFRYLIYVDSKSGRIDQEDEVAEKIESSEIWRFRHYLDSKRLGLKEVLVNLSDYVSRQCDGCPVVADGGTMAFNSQGRPFYIDVEYNGGGGHVTDVLTGEVVAKIVIPAAKPTSCCWVGEYMIFTTTREGLHEVDQALLSPEMREKYNNSGHLYWCTFDDLHGRTPFKVKIGTWKFGV